MRTKAEIDLEYTQQAVQVGHKTSLITEHKTALEALQGDIQSHLGKMLELRKEVAALSSNPPVDAV